MYVRNEVNTAMLTDVHSKAFIVHTDGTDSGDTVNIYKYISDVSTVVTKHNDFVEYAKKCIVADIVTDAAGSATQGFTCKVNNVTTTSVKTSYIDLNNSIRFATFSFNESEDGNNKIGNEVSATNQLFVLDINTNDSSSLGGGGMLLEKVHAYDVFLHDGGSTSSKPISMLQLYKDASFLSGIVHIDGSLGDTNRTSYIDINGIQSRGITVNHTEPNQAKCVITNNKIAFSNATNSDIEYIQLSNTSTGGLTFKGNLTTSGNINANDGVITCNKLLVKFNSGYADIIEVLSSLLGGNKS